MALLIAVILYFLPLKLAIAILAFLILYEAGAALERYVALDHKISKQSDRLQAYSGRSSNFDAAKAIDLIKSLDPGTDVNSLYFEKKLKLTAGASHDLLEWLYDFGYLQSGDDLEIRALRR